MSDVDFIELMEDELASLDFDALPSEEMLCNEALLSLDDAELLEIQEELDISDDEMDEIMEATQRAVNSSGAVRRVKSRAARSRSAGQTTGLSKTERKRRAIKAARTKKRNPAGLRKAMKKRNKAIKKRKMMNIK